MIPYAFQNIVNEDVSAVKKVLYSRLLTKGPAIKKFENKVANYCGAKNAIAVNSALARFICLMLH